MRSTFPLLFLLVACGKADDSNDDFPMFGDDDDVVTDHPAGPCAGPQTGSFTGDATGSIDADLSATGLLSVLFASSIGTVNLSEQLETNGQIDSTAATLTLVGTYNYGSCSGTGTWDETSVPMNGNWQMSLE